MWTRQTPPENSCKNPGAAATKGCASKPGSGKHLMLKMLRVEQPCLAGATHDTPLEHGDERGAMDSMPRTRTVRTATVQSRCASAMPTVSDVSANANASHKDLTRLRGDLLRFATLQLRDHASAEDAVQEAMLAAMSKMSEFRGQAQLSTWVFAILKNKIVD